MNEPPIESVMEAMVLFRKHKQTGWDPRRYATATSEFHFNGRPFANTGLLNEMTARGLLERVVDAEGFRQYRIRQEFDIGRE